jgi:hypothetical protein
VFVLVALALGQTSLTAAGAEPTKSPTAAPSPTPSPSPVALATASHLTSGGAMLAGSSSVNTALISPDPAQTVLVYVSTLIGDGSAPLPTLTGGRVTWAPLLSVTKTKADGRPGPRRLTLFSRTGVAPGALTITVPPVTKQYVSWSIAQARGSVAQVGSTGTALAGPLATVTLPNGPTGTVVAGFLIGSGSTMSGVSGAAKLGQGNTASFPSSTSTYASAARTVEVTWTPDGPGHYLGAIVEMKAT